MAKVNGLAAGLLTRLKEQYGDSILLVENQPMVYIAADKLTDLLGFVKTDGSYGMDWLSNLTAVDYPAYVEVVYHVNSRTLYHNLTVKVRLEKSGEVLPSVASIVSLWPGADWQEREVYDLMGVTFTGHPNLTRILLPEDFEGHPLQKNYKLPSRQENVSRGEERGSKVRVC
ncbi:NADH-quinone oxidoreductase subunit C [Acetonema longum]|uniref:NADH (Or F420H2) dehydrogenase, subunit C n=1 Tax=Acetonema longum DSM 6540 TaxID=1009370 RepID=F7NDE1_9FIRM|nr:NADH-quinone oxidoreductase subunit C [Acetonema longum]EGO65973.1 NADH (or F420H2) dehydrogenase, subunit C [Acetonema longum DSM 6540]